MTSGASNELAWSQIVHDEEIARKFVGPEWEGRWVKLRDAPMTVELDSLMELLIQTDPRLAERRWASHGGHEFELVGVAFPEEVRQSFGEPDGSF